MKNRTLALIGGGLLAGALALGGLGIAMAQTAGSNGPFGPGYGPGYGYGPGMMDGYGPGGMMGGYGSGMMGDVALETSTPEAVRAQVQRLQSAATVDRQANTLTYTTKEVELVALGSPEGSPDMTWNVEGLVNPKIVVPLGSSVTVHFYDADADEPHGWELISAGPPFSQMAMMDGPLAFPDAFGMPVPKATDSAWYGRDIHFTASRPGPYTYICPIPGHAQQGMYGTFLVNS